MLERLTKTPEYRVFWVITSARSVLTAAMSVGAEILGKYRTRPSFWPSAAGSMLIATVL